MGLNNKDVVLNAFDIYKITKNLWSNFGYDIIYTIKIYYIATHDTLENYRAVC